MFVKKILSKKNNKTYFVLVYNDIYITFDLLVIARLLKCHYTNIGKLFADVDKIEIK